MIKEWSPTFDMADCRNHAALFKVFVCVGIHNQQPRLVSSFLYEGHNLRMLHAVNVHTVHLQSNSRNALCDQVVCSGALTSHWISEISFRWLLCPLESDLVCYTSVCVEEMHTNVYVESKQPAWQFNFYKFPCKLDNKDNIQKWVHVFPHSATRGSQVSIKYFLTEHMFLQSFYNYFHFLSQKWLNFFPYKKKVSENCASRC